MEYLDSFNSGDSNRLDKIIAELKDKYPAIDWQTKWYDSEDIKGNPTSSISLMVSSSQYEEAEQIYQELKDVGFDFESLIFRSTSKSKDHHHWCIRILYSSIRFNSRCYAWSRVNR